MHYKLGWNFVDHWLDWPNCRCEMDNEFNGTTFNIVLHYMCWSDNENLPIKNGHTHIHTLHEHFGLHHLGFRFRKETYLSVAQFYGSLKNCTQKQKRNFFLSKSLGCFPYSFSSLQVAILLKNNSFFLSLSLSTLLVKNIKSLSPPTPKHNSQIRANTNHPVKCPLHFRFSSKLFGKRFSTFI